MATTTTRRTSITEFIHTEAAGGIVLVVATLVALVWANSPWEASYHTFWDTELALSLGDRSISLTLAEWVNEGLMTVFFFVVGLEIKRELVAGELASPRRAALPAIAAIGGMLFPALIYLTINLGGDGQRGWGIPMATDIAIAIGVGTLLGSRMPPALKVFLLALAIVDDIGTIVVIALFYSGTINYEALLIAGVVLLVIAACRGLGVRFIPVFVALGACFWLALHEAGIHPTIGGVVLALIAPMRPLRSRELISDDDLLDMSSPESARQTVVLARESISVVAWLELLLHPWSSLVIVPIFALANAGIPLSASDLSDAATSRIAYGVFFGLVVGKLVGITLFAWLAVRSKLGQLAEGVTWSGVSGVAALAGIGFTVSIFVAGLAFDDVALQDEAKVGILAASLFASALGVALLSAAARPRARQLEPHDSPRGSNRAQA
jgi:NhaA family Na+:H+ antiporter